MLDRALSNKLTFYLSLRALPLILLIIVVFAYLWQVNSVATSGYELKELEKKISILEKRHSKLLLQATELRALSRVEEKSRELGMVANDTIYYLTADKGVVALGR